MSIVFKSIVELNQDQVQQYRKSVRNAFPDIVHQSPVIVKYWSKVEQYFPAYQVFAINESDQVVGFINSIPFHWEGSLDILPREGWDWMLIRGIEGYEKEIAPNSLGGLQIIVSGDFLGQGYSKVIINRAKRLVSDSKFDHFVIPIRPTYKSRHPQMAMEDYIHYEIDNKIYDPWIRTHLNGGAKIISICDRAMHIYGNLDFWESMMKKSIDKSGEYIVEGALNPVQIDVSKDYGEYYENNIWISYPVE